MSLPQRVHPRLSGYDYASQGAYFLTICTRERKCILSHISPPKTEADNAALHLTAIGEIVEMHLKRIPGLDAYVIMPNHIHLILFRDANDENAHASISGEIRSFKTITSKKAGFSLWQTSFHDHILRDPNDYLFHRRYIDANPVKWTMDRYYAE